ncbi:hypothetical protein CYLTODRAFT_405894 [Cylindrobasidium torrendii FP15055 ss-10]|uniref:Uncharacterized protein n=1 Tax=Cylindrobasidium torrendii FP15055 ss-10 TaxID=1314674 RepID=A0A0D7ATG8_9AGAR|nr:hypothetical protein CYLTODRAFT_405894 [Cylindrobasidium torrendii FP15055 ss-10]
MELALLVLEKQTWGFEWDALLSHWVLLEAEFNFKKEGAPLPTPPSSKEAKKVGKASRPQILITWIKSARPPLEPLEQSTIERLSTKHVKGSARRAALPVPVSDAELISYINAWDNWWRFLQPSWREVDNEKLARGKWRKDWGGLKTYGKNGWLSIVCSLWWWHRALDMRPSTTEGEWASWREALSDVLWVLEGVRYYSK